MIFFRLWSRKYFVLKYVVLKYLGSNMCFQVMSTCLSTLRKVLARVQPAWNVWDVSEKMNKSRQDSVAQETDLASNSVTLDTDLAREATESLPGSPVIIPAKAGLKFSPKIGIKVGILSR